MEKLLRADGRADCKRLTKLDGGGILRVSQKMGVSGMAFDEAKYKNDFARSNYDRMSLNVPKGKRAELKKIADERGISINQLIIEALESHYDIDLSKFGY